MKLRALIILHPDFEEIEAITPIDLLSRAGVEITQASIDNQTLVTGRSGITLQATHQLEELCEAFDITILPGGPGIMKIRQHPLICQRLQQQVENGGVVACICAAPLLLKDAGLLDGVAYTAHPSTFEELGQARAKAVIAEASIITSRGAGTATEFSLKIIERLCGNESAKEIASAICWSH